MRSFYHLTPRYLWNRLSLMCYEWNNPNFPWLTCDMINILETWLCSTDIGLEFGSGRSTNWIASRVRHLTSVEDNPVWYQRVSNQINGKLVDYLLREDGSTNSADSEYVGVARHKPQNSLDFCLVDGTARDYCALICLDKLKTGGILIIDDVERYIPREPKTLSPNARIKNWRFIWTTNGVKDTAFWVKP